MVRKLLIVMPLFLSLSSQGHENKKDKDHKKSQPPVAAFSFTQLTFVSPFKVKFDASASSSPNAPIHDYIWDFGDNSRHHFDCDDERKEHRGSVHRAIVEHTYRKPGIYRVTLKVVDKRGGHAKIFKDIRVVLAAPPVANLSVKPSANGVAPFYALLDASASSSPVGLPLTYKFTFGDGNTVTVSNPQIGHGYNLPGTYLASVRVTDSSGLFSDKSISITVTAPVVPQPPVAPPLVEAAPQSFDQRVNFIYQGPNAIQTGVLPGAIITSQVSLIRGRVLDDAGAPLPGVTISVFGKTALGQTLSRSTGEFDIAVNGGDIPVILKYVRSGYTPAQRELKIGKLDHVAIPDVMLSRFDSKVTTVQLGSSITQVHSANPVSDQDGTRTATVVIKPQTTAQLVLADGSLRSVSQLSVRATEVTVGADGPKRMPADLPTNTSYTYAVDLSADEAVALGAKSINFSKPVAYYVDNFRNIPVGSVIPSGFLNQEKGYWQPEPDGIVLQILNVTGGAAVVDVRGSGQPASAADLQTLGIDAQELQTLASYPVGKTLWRVPIAHFSFFDFNFAGLRLPDHFENEPAEPPPPCEGDCLCKTGCEIEVGRRVWRETIPLLGTGLDLRYSSDRVAGWFGDSTIGVTLLKGAPSNNLKYIDVNTSIAGRDFPTHVLRTDSKDYRMIWDGKDAFGRDVTQPTTATVNLEYTFDIMDFVTSYWLRGFLLSDQTFNSPWDPTASGVRLASRGLYIYKQAMTFTVSPPNSYISENARREVGGWTLANHHQFDPVRRRVYKGDGTITDLKAMPLIVRDIAGGGSNNGDGGLALASSLRFPVYYRRNADGTAYISDSGNSRIRKIDANGIIQTYAGTGTFGYSGDGGLATAANIGTPVGIYPGQDGSLYFSDASQHVIRKIDASGVISTVVGTGVAGFSGDNGPAASAQINTPLGIIIMNDGSMLFADSGNHVIRQVLPSGIIRIYAGMAQQAGYSGDGGAALGAKFQNPDLTFLDIAQNLYITDSGNHVIRVIRPGGIIETVAGSGQQGFSGDGGPALSAKLNSPQNVVVSDRGIIYFSDSGNHVIRSVDKAGNIFTIAGKPGVAGYDGGDNAPDQSMFNFPTGLFLMPDESLYIADTFNNRVRYLTATPQGIFGNLIAIPTADGSEINLFDIATGRHQSTLFGKTGAVKWQFAYSPEGDLISMTNQDGDVTQVMRDSSGRATQILGPYGQVFNLTMDANGYLRSIRQPTGETYQITSAANGLITQFQDPRGGFSSPTYNTDGTIAQDTDPAGATKFFTFLLNKITSTSDMGRKSSSQQVHDSYFPSLWTILTENADGSSSSQQQIGSTQYTRDNSGLSTQQSRVDARFGPSTRFPSLQTLTSADSGFYSETRQVRNYVVRSPFDFDMQEVRTKDLSFVTTKVYSSVDRTTTITTGAGRLNRTTVDSNERPISVQVGSFNPVTFLYDSRGRLVQVKQGTRTTSMTYDSSGFLASSTDPLGLVTNFINDASGRLLSKTLPDGRVIQTGYDGNSNLIGLITPANQSHGMDFSPLNKISAYRPPNLLSGPAPTVYSYNRDGQISSIVRPDGQTLSYVYEEPKDRIQRIGTVSQSRVFTYDSKARLATGTSSDGVSLQYQFDGTLPLSKFYSVDAISASASVSYSNPGLRINSRTVGTHSVNIGYDLDEMISQVDALSLSRDTQSGLVTGLTLNSVQESMAYSAFAELASKQVYFNSSPIFGEAFVRDGLGRITQKSETINGVTTVYQYSFDSSGRLTDVVKDGVNVGHYVFDANSNRIAATINGVSVSGTYDSQDRVVTYAGKSYAFTANGDLQSKSDGSSYSYDVFGQTKSVTVGGNTVSYKNDSEGRRVVRYLNGNPDRAFIYNELGQLVGEFDSGGAIVSSFHYASQSHSPDLMLKGSVKYYLVKDHIGSIRLVVNSQTGAIAQRMDYDEFGRVLADSNPGFQPFGFAGGHYDSTTKLVRFGARDYDSELGRWTSRDPILFGGGDSSLYLYSFADPVNYLDPSGLSSMPGISPGEGGTVPARTYPGQAAGAARDFYRNYRDMRNANTVGADKYFHCMASCQGSQRGSGGFDASRFFGEGREYFDEYVKRDPRTACDADRAANERGRNAEPWQSCKNVCGSLRPPGLGPGY